MSQFRKILIANRGEIAYRIIRAVNELGIVSVAVFAEDDKNSLHIQEADEAYSLGEGIIKETYLNMDTIIRIAISSGCDAIHPGYGFLSENPLFEEACRKHNIVFIGPSAQALRLMGNKTEARNTVKALGIPVLMGYECPVTELLAIKDLRFPLIIKPVLGGGGKGMHVAHHADELLRTVKAASREAGNYFADARVYFEQYIEFARHIEVQIAADHSGNVVHLFERECSVQRNFQKIIEEAPSPSLNPELRDAITSAAVQIARAANYTNVGTVEFLLDDISNWYFIEMNTRIQVEHPVTEAITGIDLVKLQISIASGLSLPFTQDSIGKNGHAIELRLNAEDPLNHFRPSSGEITLFEYPAKNRFETFIKSPYTLTSHYDSLLGKLVVWAENRGEALQKASRLLREVHVHGVNTNLLFLAAILSSNEFRDNKWYTRFCHNFIPSFVNQTTVRQNQQPFYIPLIAFVYLNFLKKVSQPSSVWEQIGYWRIIQEVRIKNNAENFTVRFKNHRDQWKFRIAETEYEAQFTEKPEYLLIRVNGTSHNVYYSLDREERTFIETGGFIHTPESPDKLSRASVCNEFSQTADGFSNCYIRAPLHGRVIKINVLENTKINRGDVLLVIESMKTENSITAPKSGIIKTIHVSEGVQVKDNTLLMELEYHHV